MNKLRMTYDEFMEVCKWVENEPKDLKETEKMRLVSAKSYLKGHESADDAWKDYYREQWEETEKEEQEYIKAQGMDE